MLDLSVSSIIEKNSIAGDGAWILLLEIKLKTPATTLRLTRNTDPITWNLHTWTPFPFDLDEMTEDSRGETPTISIKISNVTRIVQYYMEAGDGAVGAEVTLYVVHSKHLDTTASFEETFEITDSAADNQWITINLGAGYPVAARRPEDRMLKNFCNFEYGGIRCGIPAATKVTYPTCNKTLANCRERNNKERYGGEPSLTSGGIYV